MSDVPLTQTTLKTAQLVAPRARPRALVRAKPLQETQETIVVNGDMAARKPVELGPVIIRVEDVNPATVAAGALVWVGLRGGMSVAASIVQVVIHEAPAWAVSMLVHMMTLVTMAMVTVPDPPVYQAQHLTVTPTEEEKLEDIKKSGGDQPSTLDENLAAETVTFESNMGREKLDFQGSDEPEAMLAAVDLSDYGLENVAKGDLLAKVGVYSGVGLAARKAGNKAQLVMQEGGDASSEKAVSGALRWLANHQLPDGGWNFKHSVSPSCRTACRNPGTLSKARNAATGLALLPFLGTGQTHKEGRYKITIQRGLEFLKKRMRVGAQGGALNEREGQMYAHGLASIALCEAYAMTRDPELLEPAQQALNFIAFAQDPLGGGWRYNPKDPGDTSIVGWQLMALKSGHMANLRVSPLTIHKASLYLDSVQRDNGANYGYITFSDGSEATSAIGLLCRMYLGWKRDNPSLQRGVKFLAGRGPSGANMYYNYYATQVMHHFEGAEFKNWNRQMRDQLVHAQAKQGHEDGSWFTGTGDNGAGAGGRLYCTAMAAMILEVYYRHLPLYRAASVDQDFPE